MEPDRRSSPRASWVAIAAAAIVAIFVSAIAYPAYADEFEQEWEVEAIGDELRLSGSSAGSSGGGGSGGSSAGSGRRLPLCDPAVVLTDEVSLADCAANRTQCFMSDDGGPGVAFVYWVESGQSRARMVECLPLGESLAVTASDFAVMKIPPPVAVRQPAKPESLVNVALIVYAEPGVQVFTATVLGEVVSIRATPVAYSWDFRDPDATGSNPSVVYSRSSGRPYPNHTIAHTYTRPGWVSQSLTTTYRGEYAISANPVNSDWIPIPGTAQNTVEIPAHEVVETRPQLEESR